MWLPERRGRIDSNGPSTETHMKFSLCEGRVRPRSTLRTALTCFYLHLRALDTSTRRVLSSLVVETFTEVAEADC